MNIKKYRKTTEFIEMLNVLTYSRGLNPRETMAAPVAQPDGKLPPILEEELEVELLSSL